jgi:hypothetical protein
MKRNKFLQGPILPIAAVALLALSTAGSTRAALTTRSNDFSAQLETAVLSVALVENGNTVEATETTNAEGETVEAEGTLLTNLLADGESFQVGKKYNEVISAKNDGDTYDEYVRVIITKSWRNGADSDGVEGEKDTTLDPDLIELTFADGWLKDENASTKEQLVYYYTKPLAAGESAELVTALRVAESVTTVVSSENTQGMITTTYDYNGKSFSIDAEVDAVQTHSAKAAILGAWGVDVTLNDAGTILSIDTVKPVATTETDTMDESDTTDETDTTDESEGGQENE